jgi:hypothetical protein
MKTNATHLRIWASASIAILSLTSAPLSAQEELPQEAPRPITEENVTALDVATTPLRDLNLEQDEIPSLLLEAQADPYSTAGLRRCSQYGTAIGQLDAILGPDFDLIGQTDRKLSVGGVAQSVVSALIPFRGVIREISGARRTEQDLQDAVMAGMMRRAFLKGMGLKIGCAWPARPADDNAREHFEAEQRAAVMAAEYAEQDREAKED